MSKCISVKRYNLGNLNIGLLIIWGPGFEQMGSIRISERNRCEVLGKNTNQSSTREQLQTCDFLFTRLSLCSLQEYICSTKWKCSLSLLEIPEDSSKILKELCFFNKSNVFVIEHFKNIGRKRRKLTWPLTSTLGVSHFLYFHLYSLGLFSTISYLLRIYFISLLKKDKIRGALTRTHFLPSFLSWMHWGGSTVTESSVFFSILINNSSKEPTL